MRRITKKVSLMKYVVDDGKQWKLEDLVYKAGRYEDIQEQSFAVRYLSKLLEYSIYGAIILAIIALLKWLVGVIF